MVTEPERIADEDLARIVAFLDGEMMGDEAHDFKLRLMGEPALRRALLEFEEAETLLQKGVGRGARSSAGEEVAMDQPTASSVEAVLQPRPARILRMPVLLPAAAALVLLLGLWQVFGGDANQPGFDMAPLATTATLEQYHDQLGLPPRQRRQILRAQEETPPDYWSDEEYLAGVAAKEQEQREAWLKNRQDSAVPVGSAENPLRVPSGYLTLQLHLEEEASPVVLLVRSTGEVSLLYPSEEYPANGDRGSARLSAGVVHCLPRPTLRFKSDLQGSRRIEHDTGFFLPRGIGSCQFLIAARRDPVGTIFKSTFTEFLAGLPDSLPAGKGTPERLTSAAEAAMSWIGDRDFGLQVLHVVGP